MNGCPRTRNLEQQILQSSWLPAPIYLDTCMNDSEGKGCCECRDSDLDIESPREEINEIMC